jgi:transcriptional regulator with XRE-family HTH domain
MFWDTVKETIRDHDTTQEWVAKKAGVSFNTLHGWISKGVLPRADDAVRIARALNTSVEYLVTGGTEREAALAADLNGHISRIQRELTALAKTAKKVR